MPEDEGLEATVLPAEETIRVRRAQDCVLDAWRGAAKWASDAKSKATFVTRGEVLEKGGEYLKEHSCGNAYSS